MAEPSIHIHEDDLAMRSLHPIAAFVEVAADVAASVEAGERNRAPSGVGWTAVHMIAEPKANYTDIGLQLSEVADMLETIFPRIKKFKATATSGFGPQGDDPYGSYEDEAWCFGIDHTCFIKLETDGALVRHIWFECQRADPTSVDGLRRAIVAVDALAESFISDYWLGENGRVRDAAFLDSYVSALAR